MQEFLHQFFDVGFMLDHFGEVIEGFKINLELFLVSAVLALAWGLFLALLRQLPGRPAKPVRGVTIAYIDVFRAVPLLILVLMFGLGIPALSFLPETLRLPHWLGKPDSFWLGSLALIVTYGAYMAEVYRAGIEAVPGGQMEAARSLGMSHFQSMRNVIVPQAVRKIPAPMLNELIALLKDTTLVSVIALNEVIQTSTDIQTKTFNASALTLGALMFLVIILPAARVVDKLIARSKSKLTRGSHIEVA
ncbi:MAG TPA: amino acid ABC transporter permease [Solirubrobacterales bacterium]|jgi:polar amino acid transport system permease protein